MDSVFYDTLKLISFLMIININYIKTSDVIQIVITIILLLLPVVFSIWILIYCETRWVWLWKHLDIRYTSKLGCMPSRILCLVNTIQSILTRKKVRKIVSVRWRNWSNSAFIVTRYCTVASSSYTVTRIFFVIIVRHSCFLHIPTSLSVIIIII